MGMTCDICNMLRQSANTIDEGGEDQGGYAFMLRQLGDHIRELHDRYRRGDAKVVDEFFAIYVVPPKPAG